MNVEKMLPVETLIPLVEEYTPIANQMFDYLNGRVNPPYNMCKLIISSYDQCNFAEFRKPNIVILFLYSIISSFYPNDMDIKSVMLMTLTHELSHACQETNMVKYGSDPFYREQVENSNEAHARLWVLNHMNEIHRRFGFTMTFPQWAIEEAKRNDPEYQQTSGKYFYLYAIVDILYRRQNFVQMFESIFDSYDEMFIAINDSNKVWFKHKGQYLLDPDTVKQFGDILSYCRRGMALGAFHVVLNQIQTEIKVPNLPPMPALILNFEISNFRYAPIIGIETVSQLDSMRRNNQL